MDSLFTSVTPMRSVGHRTLAATGSEQVQCRSPVSDGAVNCAILRRNLGGRKGHNRVRSLHLPQKWCLRPTFVKLVHL